MTNSAREIAKHSTEQAWFTGVFSVNSEKGSGEFRLYIYPGKHATFPADIRIQRPGESHELVFEGRATLSEDRLSFFEKANQGHPEQPEWICTLSAVRLNDEMFLGGSETETGLFEPENALKIAQLQRSATDSPEGRAMTAQASTLLKRGQPFEMRVDQDDRDQSTLH